jgi:hypothetical protein
MLSIASLPEPLQAPIFELLRAVLSRGGLLPFDEVPDNLLQALGVCNGLDRAWTEMKGRLVCLTMAGQAAFELHEASLAPAKVRRPRQAKAKAMPSAAKKTDESAGLPESKPYPVHVASMAPEVVEQLRPASPRVALTNEDRYILTVLDAHRGKALTFDQIARESVKMEQKDRKKIRRLSDSMIRQRVPILLHSGLVARPPGTEKKGVSITDAGHQALALTHGNPQETDRKK